jgi:hypothetical protein
MRIRSLSGPQTTGFGPGINCALFLVIQWKRSFKQCLLNTSIDHHQKMTSAVCLSCHREDLLMPGTPGEFSGVHGELSIGSPIRARSRPVASSARFDAGISRKSKPSS